MVDFQDLHRDLTCWVTPILATQADRLLQTNIHVTKSR